MDFKHQKAITSEPEFFAQLVENREAIPLLAPFAARLYDIAVELRTDVAFTKYYWCTIKRVFPEKDGQHWEASGKGNSVVEAVRQAVAQAQPMIGKYGL